LIGGVQPEAVVIKSIEAVGRINLYRQAWPDSRTLFVIRHPCGQIASTLEGIKRGKFASQISIYDDIGVLARMAGMDQAKRYGVTCARLSAMSPIQRLAWMWMLPNEKALEDVARDPSIKIVRYRDLCERPIELSQELFRLVGITWDPTVEEFLRNSTAAQYAEPDNYYSVFRDPKLSVDRWRTVLTDEQINEIRAVVEGSPPERLFEFW
jgi:hypothetical protein